MTPNLNYSLILCQVVKSIQKCMFSPVPTAFPDLLFHHFIHSSSKILGSDV